ncbi:protein kinase [Streptomyces coeruleoprunus]|uniref:non-specific serine/threonine protein kinase n=1 Tax=Streptomyces coeruleoprunus TaxID=285563 RepID=A0ABV9XN65_9ACTN
MHRRGETIDGRYRLEGLLGRGGMGEVWSAEDVKLGRLVAIKFLRLPSPGAAGATTVQDAIVRFENEARLLARVGHDNVVTVHDWGRGRGDSGGDFYMTMELLEGRTLDQLLADGPPAGQLPPLADVVEWAARICDVLVAAHAKGVIHRDIKPSNVLVTRGGAVKVLDFGIAKLVESSGPQLTGTVIGTPPYMAPEQFTGHASAASDLFALGCLLYALVTGAPPARSGVAPVAVRPKNVRTDLPSALDDLIHRLLRQDPAARPANAAEVRRTLTRVASTLAARPEPARPQPRPRAQSGLGAAPVPPLLGQGPGPARQVAPRPAGAARPEPGLAAFRDLGLPAPPVRGREAPGDLLRNTVEVSGSCLVAFLGTFLLVFTATGLSLTASFLWGVGGAVAAVAAEAVSRLVLTHPPAQASEDEAAVLILTGGMAWLLVLGGCIWLMAAQTGLPWWGDTLAGCGLALGVLGMGLTTYFGAVDELWGGDDRPGPEAVLFNGVLLGATAFGVLFVAADMAWWTALLAAAGIWIAGAVATAFCYFCADEVA